HAIIVEGAHGGHITFIVGFTVSHAAEVYFITIHYTLGAAFEYTFGDHTVVTLTAVRIRPGKTATCRITAGQGAGERTATGTVLVRSGEDIAADARLDQESEAPVLIGEVVAETEVQIRRDVTHAGITALEGSSICVDDRQSGFGIAHIAVVG